MSDLGLTLEQLLQKPELHRRIGHFVLVRQLGRGGFAPVWLANETFGGKTLRAAAVKIFALDEHDSSASRRIIAEASALCRVEHPNVVRFYSLAVDEDLGILGLGMEFVAGRSVATRLEQAGLMRPDQVVDLGLAVASALEAVHLAGIVHRDIKPANIMDTDQGYKLVDFGISLTETVSPDKAGAPPTNDPNSTGRVAALQSGTLGYVDPVMIAAGAPASPASDLYALGATLFECLTGQLPASADRKKFDENILDGRKSPPRVSDCAENVPSGLAAIIDKLISPDRSQRYASADELIQAFERLYAIPAPPPSPLPMAFPSLPPPPPAASQPRWVLPAAAAFAIAVVMGAYGLPNPRGQTLENSAPAVPVKTEQTEVLVPMASATSAPTASASAASAPEEPPPPPKPSVSRKIIPDKPHRNLPGGSDSHTDPSPPPTGTSNPIHPPPSSTASSQPVSSASSGTNLIFKGVVW